MLFSSELVLQHLLYRSSIQIAYFDHQMGSEQQQQQEGGSGSTCDTLSVSCYKTLTKAPINSAQLQELPQHILVQLLEKAAAERDAAEELAKAQAA